MKKAICLDRNRIFSLSVPSAVLPLRLADADWDDSSASGRGRVLTQEDGHHLPAPSSDVITSCSDILGRAVMDQCGANYHNGPGISQS